MINFIKTYYEYIIVLALIVIILVNIIISLFKKDDKVEATLKLNNERKNHNYSFEKQAVIFRNIIQDYQAKLFDNKGKIILETKLESSIISTKSILDNINELIESKNYQIREDLSNKLYALFYIKDVLSAKTCALNNVDEVNSTIENISKLLSQLSINKEIYTDNECTDLEEITFDKKDLVVNELKGQFYLSLNIDNHILNSYLYDSKKEVQRLQKLALDKDIVFKSVNNKIKLLSSKKEELLSE